MTPGRDELRNRTRPRPRLSVFLLQRSEMYKRVDSDLAPPFSTFGGLKTFEDEDHDEDEYDYDY
jgi:hypothetical protein